MSNRVFAATRKGLFTVDRQSGKWNIARVHFLGDQVGMVLPDSRDGHMYVSIEHQHFGPKLHRSKDGGESWEEIPAPVYPPKPEGEVDLDPWKQTPRLWKLERVWALTPGHASEPGHLWCGTLPGGLFRSRDRGASWELVHSLWNNPKRKEWFGGGADLPGIHSVCVDPRNARRVAVGVSCGGVWLTEDGGETWNCRADGMWAAYMPPEKKFEPNIQDPHCVVQCLAAPDHYWAQHHNGVFKSTDNLKSWQEVATVQPSVFGFPVAVHPKDPNTAWFVPAINDERRIPVSGQVVVARTRDGGKTCETLRKGLPQEHAYDIVYRHALDVDGAGKSLAFGSTTGSLWISDDAGDSWQTVTQHLPPVYCVRFVN
jgi:photosystem II stability/assembly factor-like uncharacterized protein